MLIKFFAFLLISICFSFSVMAQDRMVDPCENAITQTEMNVCAFASLEQVEQEMQSVYERALKHFSEKEMKDAFVQSHETWLEYREDHCEFSADQYEGGTIRPLVLAACMETLTQQRTWHIVNLFPEWD
jgi:uncharacterized protein YecT (DUF1311 family)